MNIIRNLKPTKWDFNYEIIGDESHADKFYVLETLDNEQYRILTPWDTPRTELNHRESQSFKPALAANYSIPKHKITPLITYLKNSNQPNRVSSYQTLAAKQMIQNMFLRKPLSLEYIEEQSKDIDMQLIRNEIYLKVMNLFKTIISKDYKAGASIKNNSDINDIIHSDDVREIFASTLLNLYSVGVQSNKLREFDANHFPFSELLCSFMLEMDIIVRRFMKELHDGYNRAPFAKEYFDSSADEKSTALTEKLDEILLKILAIILNDKDNIYISLNAKYLLLNFS